MGGAGWFIAGKLEAQLAAGKHGLAVATGRLVPG